LLEHVRVGDCRISAHQVSDSLADPGRGDDEVGLRYQLGAPDRQQARITRAGADKGDPAR
jgi:hypothetical protein